MRGGLSAPHEAGDVAQGRVVEQVADIELARVLLLDGEDDLRQRQ